MQLNLFNHTKHPDCELRRISLPLLATRDVYRAVLTLNGEWCLVKVEMEGKHLFFNCVLQVKFAICSTYHA